MPRSTRTPQTPGRRTRPRPARARILAAAEELFYARGTSATGIDAVTDRAGVARKSLYNNFASKDELVAAWLEQRHADWLAFHAARFRATTDAVSDAASGTTTDATTGTAADAGAGTASDAAASGPDAGHPALAVFDAYLDHAASAGDGFRGCGLLNTAAEYPAGSRVRDTVRRHKEEVGQLLADAAPEHAEMLSYLLEGAVTRAGLDGTPDRLHRARAMAARILDVR